MAEEKKEEEAAEGTEAAAAPKKSNKKLFMIIGGVVVLLLAAGIPLLFMGKKTEEKPVAELENGIATHEEEGEEHSKMIGSDEESELIEGEEPLGAIFPLETFVVNIQGGKFIRLQVQLEFADRAVSSRFTTRIVLVRDQIISLLSSKSPDDLSSAKAKDSLKSDIKELVNDVLKKEEVRRVYFSQFIIQ